MCVCGWVWDAGEGDGEGDGFGSRKMLLDVFVMLLIFLHRKLLGR